MNATKQDPAEIKTAAISDPRTEATQADAGMRACAACEGTGKRGGLDRKDFATTLVLMVICAAIIGVCLFFRGSMVVLGIGFVTACCFLELTVELVWELARAWFFRSRCSRCGQR